MKYDFSTRLSRSSGTLLLSSNNNILFGLVILSDMLPRHAICHTRYMPAALPDGWVHDYLNECILPSCDQTWAPRRRLLLTTRLDGAEHCNPLCMPDLKVGNHWTYSPDCVKCQFSWII